MKVQRQSHGLHYTMCLSLNYICGYINNGMQKRQLRNTSIKDINYLLESLLISIWCMPHSTAALLAVLHKFLTFTTTKCKTNKVEGCNSISSYSKACIYKNHTVIACHLALMTMHFPSMNLVACYYHQNAQPKLLRQVPSPCLAGMIFVCHKWHLWMLSVPT